RPSHVHHPSPPLEPATLPLHDALPIYSIGDRKLTGGDLIRLRSVEPAGRLASAGRNKDPFVDTKGVEFIVACDVGNPLLGENGRSEEHTSELQSRFEVVCRLLLEKKKPPGGQPGKPPEPATPPVPQSPSPNPPPPPPAVRPDTTTESAPLRQAPSVPADDTPAHAA